MSYESPWWLPDGHSQTIVSARFYRKPMLEYFRERWATPDGDFIDIDFTHPPEQRPEFRSLWVLFHGLEGCSRSHYSLSLMKQAREEGNLGAVVHFRGCSGENNILPRAYHSGDSAEIDWVLRRFRKEFPGLNQLCVTGVSLGGNVLLKWLGEQGELAGQVIDRAMAVSAPVNLLAGAVSLAKGFNRVYTRMFLSTLLPKAIEKVGKYPELGDVDQLKSCRDFFDFDGRVTAPWHGFKDALDYYDKSSANQFLPGIRVPTLMIHARNDPFMSGEYLPKADELPKAVRALFTETGGHVGFGQGRPGRVDLGWLPSRFTRFVADPEAFDHG